jgi:hypothetical protein
MKPELITFRTFNDIALANNLVLLLEKHQIIYQLEELKNPFDPAFRINDPTLTEYAVKISNTDFEQVNQILNDSVAANLDDVESDYYLFDFTDDELMEILVKPDEWNAFDFLLARKILADRGKNVTDESILNFGNKRIEELRKPEPSQNFWIVIGYICALCGGILGVFIGWHLSSYKKTLPNGERVFEYSENDRKHGKRILYLSIPIFILFFILKMLSTIYG